jgi:hypothetical protein
VRKVHETLAKYADGDPEKVSEAMPVLAELIQGHPLTEEMWEPSKREARTHTWIPVLPRSLRQGDRVRVRSDAYEGSMAVHNGRTGHVSALRGDVIVNYDGGGMSMGSHHRPEMLERQVPIPRGVTQ